MNKIITKLQINNLMTFKATPSFGMQSIDVSSLQKGNYLIGFGKNLTAKFIVK